LLKGFCFADSDVQQHSISTSLSRRAEFEGRPFGETPMRTRTFNRLSTTLILGGLFAATACSGGEDYPPLEVGGSRGLPQPTGGMPTTTGGAPANTGGVATGGVATGGIATGGITATAGGTGGTSSVITGGSASTSGGVQSGGGAFSKAGSSSTGGKGGSSSAGGGRGGSTSAGGSTSVAGGTSTGTVAYSKVQGIVQTRCTTCHNGGTAPNLGTAVLYNALTTVSVSRCGGNKLVTASDPTKSALIMVVTGKCGGLRMPVGCSGTACIPQSEIDTLTAWIQQGAKNL
jgi:hypothetical protein